MAKSCRIPEVGVIALVADTWGPEWMSRHQILTRLAEHFHVVWVNPSRDWQHTFDRTAEEPRPANNQPPGFVVYEHDSWLPRFYRPGFLAKYTFRQRLERARKLLASKGCEKIILYIWRPEFVESLDAVRFDASCYHVVDEYSFSDVEVPNSPQEEELLRRAGLVFVHTRALLEKKGYLNSSVALIPNGVAYKSFADPLPEPEKLRSVPHPRVGYAGYLKKTIDWDLLLRLSAKHPEYSFVFVGARKNDEHVGEAVTELSRRPNVYLLGQVTTSAMASYPQHFDVCIMPYILNDYTSYVYPLKLHEYLASGKPVIASPTRLLKEFEGVVHLAQTTEDWSTAIAAGLSTEANSVRAREQRQRVAKEHDWDRLVKSIVEIFCEKLGITEENFVERSIASREAPCITPTYPEVSRRSS
jgi:glycosyltransferase involved in cell wall biosynthesis